MDSYPLFGYIKYVKVAGHHQKDEDKQGDVPSVKNN